MALTDLLKECAAGHRELGVEHTAGNRCVSVNAQCSHDGFLSPDLTRVFTDVEPEQFVMARRGAFTKRQECVIMSPESRAHETDRRLRLEVHMSPLQRVTRVVVPMLLTAGVALLIPVFC